MGASILLSNITRADSFSDYLCISAHQVNRLESRANVARGGGDGFLYSWYIPMPQSIQRSTQQKFAQSQTSLGYALQKLQSFGGTRGLGPFNTGGAAAVGEFAATSGGIAGQLLAGSALGLTKTAIGALDQSRSIASQFTDQPLVSISNHELRYAGSAYKEYQLVYKFVAREAADVHGPSGIIAAAAQLEAFSYPVSIATNSNRDLIGTPPMWTLKGATVLRDGTVAPYDSPPLASLGQPKLCYLSQVMVAHDTTSIMTDSLGFTYPMFTDLTLQFIEVEPLVRIRPQDGGDDYAVIYGEATSAPRLATRSEIYTIDQGYQDP